MTKSIGLAATLVLGLASVPASAGTINLSFGGGGLVEDVFNCGDNCYQLSTTGTAYGKDQYGTSYSWEFQGDLRFDNLVDQTGTGAGTGFDWRFDDKTNDNDLWGTFTSSMLDGFELNDWSNGATGIGTLDYTVTGGSGRFKDATGSGLSTLFYGPVWHIFAYGEFGQMEVNTTDSTSVPEPGSMALLATAMGLVGAGAWRRRRQVRQPS